VSEFAKIAAPLLFVVLLLTQVATVHGVSFKAIPSINQKLYGNYFFDRVSCLQAD